MLFFFFFLVQIVHLLAVYLSSVFPATKFPDMAGNLWGPSSILCYSPPLQWRDPMQPSPGEAQVFLALGMLLFPAHPQDWLGRLSPALCPPWEGDTSLPLRPPFQ